MAQQEENSDHVLSALGKKGCCDGKGCKLVTSGTRRNLAAPLSGQQLQNRFSAMMSDGAVLEATEPKSYCGTRRESEVSAE